MKKQRIQFIILAVLLVLCIGGYYLVKNTQFETDTTVEPVVLTDFDAGSVKAFAVSENRSYSFEKEGEEWIEASLPGEDIDETAVDSLLAAISYLTTTETVIQAPDDLSEYGLDEVFLTVTVTMEDDSQIVFHVGDLNDLLEKFYVQVEGDANVYMVSYSSLSGLIVYPESFVAEEETETAAEEETAVETEEETAAETEEAADETAEETEETASETDEAETVAETEAE